MTRNTAHRIAVASAAALAVALLTAGCTTGSSPQPGSTASGSGTHTTAAAPSKTFTIDDLKAIAKSVQTSQKLGGTVTTETSIKSPSSSFTSLLDNGTLKLTPASCKQLLESSSAVTKDFAGAHPIIALVSGGDLEVAISSTSGQALPDSVEQSAVTAQKTLLPACNNAKMAMSFDGKSVNIGMSFSPLTVTTTVPTYVAYSEKISVSGIATPGGALGDTSIGTLSGVDGNLLIFIFGKASQADKIGAVASAIADAAK